MPADELDPLYDPALLVIVVSAWAGTTWFVSPFVGLIVLVVASSGLVAAAVKFSVDHPSSTPFHADMSVMLVFCAAAIAGSVLVLHALLIAPALTLCGLVAMAVALRVSWLRLGRLEKSERGEEAS